MNRKCRYSVRTLFSAAFLSFLVLASVLPVQAASFSDHTSVTNNGRIGAVDITLEESFPEDPTRILPSQTVDLSSGIHNNGEPAWVRIRIEYPVTSGEVLSNLDTSSLTPLDDRLITFANENWTKIGDYYYLTKPLDTEADMAFTSAVTFPSDWDNSMKDSQFGIHFTAEAVQEAHFTPDFSSEDPWHGVVIEAFDATDYVPRTSGDDQFQIVYKDGSEGLVHVGDDFFSNWSDLMPGDTVSGTAEISNEMSIPVKLYFEMESSGDTDLLEALSLTIRNGDTVVYDGDLTGSIQPAELLMQYEPGDSTEFSYELSVPAELDNDYALSDFQTVWTFSAEEVLPVKEVWDQEIVKTGQVLRIGLFVAAGVGIVSGIGYVLTRKKGGVKHEDYK